MSESLLVLALEGEAISRVAAYSSESDSWSVRELDEPIAGSINPVLSGDLAAFAHGSRVYAFSAQQGRWDSVERAEGADGPPAINRDYVLCEDDDRVYIFGAKTGRWDAIEVE